MCVLDLGEQPKLLHGFYDEVPHFDYERCVDAYNAGCASGVDAVGCDPETLVPPDAALLLRAALPGWPNTCGGPRRAAGRARNPFDEPIEGRYAAGKLGRPVGMLYPADGANLSEASCSGRIAARAALGGGAAPQLVGKATG